MYVTSPALSHAIGSGALITFVSGESGNYYDPRAISTVKVDKEFALQSGGRVTPAITDC
jgi:hypothetical protein